MVQTIQKRNLTAEDRRIISNLIMEGLDGYITDGTRAELKNLGDHLEIPQPYGHIVGYLRGYDTDGKHLADMLVDELRIVGIEKIDEHVSEPNAVGSDWIAMYNILEQILDGGDHDLRADADLKAEAGLDLPSVNRIPAWTRPLMEHIRTSKTSGDELSLELLDVLEKQIQKRRAELKKTP